ncbi:biosynthetic peptidoglycan transglycosylase [Hymenobacter latericus]|uniref:biosynthetic peptidoglycan transglycosylase n=1 Tax=Hymenobacter sp. YIM 151858-1 TaxID=2987688 RepID=UPI002227BFE2|nr:biosynthetic peptidoglycan transglycosylase [Hymenobacter sp. YIM 151858-1]UYZ59442.1 transglycosylase domain-containing protein [Hymenobacter sp. YIM 151858-1]
MNPKTKKILYWSLGTFGALLLVGLAVFLLKREELLQYAMRQTKTKVERKYPVTLTLGPARFTDLNTVQITNVSLVPRTGLQDTLLTARRINASISLRSLFARRPVFSNLQIEQAQLLARKTATADNYGFLIKRTGKTTVPRDTTKGTNYGVLLNQVLETALENIPGEADFRNFLVAYESPRHRATITMPELTIEDGDLAGKLTVELDSVTNRIGLRGHVEQGDENMDVQVFSQGRQPVVLPYLQRRFGASVQFDTLHLQLAGKDFDDERLTVRGAALASNFRLNHPKISDEDVVVRRGGIDFVATLGQNYLALEKGTKVTLNKIVAFPQISVRMRTPAELGRRVAAETRHYSPRLRGLLVSLNVESDEVPATDFFNSLPQGIFGAVEGMQGTGTLQYHLSAALDMQQVDSLKFDSGLRASRDFKITRFGRVDLRKLNTEFAYTAYNDRGDSLKTFAVGPSNPDFVPFNQVSNYLKYAIITAEDPRFFTHKGFMEKAFVKSAIQNIKEKRFARGGSTLSMQLVKNVFLTRKKTVARKAEEALMVWLIENTRLVSKERMMEVYLNIIEWGPSRYRWPSGERGVYGVKEAARFYYDKEPSQLTLQESLYLASIIPKPKYARESFNQYGDLKASSRYFFRLIADIMARRGYIPEAEADGLSRSVNLAGPARRFMNFSARPDTTRAVAADSSQFDPINLIDLLNTGGLPDEGANTNAPATEGTDNNGGKQP